MDQDDLPPRPAKNDADDTSLGGALGMTFAGFVWVAIFAAIAAAILWAVIHWLH